MCWRKSYRFWRSTQLSRLVDTYLETLVEQKGVKKISDLKEEEQILHEVYTHSPDMQMLLNLLTEKEGIWSSILILSTFDRNFKNEFKVLKRKSGRQKKNTICFSFENFIANISLYALSCSKLNF